MDRIERIRQSFVTRKTEPSDTHDYIQHHDPDFNKNRERHSDDWQDHENDMTDISVESLILYLEGLKREDNEHSEKADKPVDPDMQKAISAYSHEENMPKPRYTYLDNDDQTINPERVDLLIENLKGLLDKGRDHISLVSAKTFLGALEKTVEKYQGL